MRNIQSFQTYLLTEGRVATEAFNRVRKAWKPILSTYQNAIDGKSIGDDGKPSDFSGELGQKALYLMRTVVSYFEHDAEFPFNRCAGFFVQVNGKPNQKWIGLLVRMCSPGTDITAPIVTNDGNVDALLASAVRANAQIENCIWRITPTFEPHDDMIRGIPAIRDVAFDSFNGTPLEMFHTADRAIRDCIAEEYAEVEARSKSTVKVKDAGQVKKVVIDFGGGWQWVDTGRGKCSIESGAMAHCGNDSQYWRQGDNIYSLRQKTTNRDGEDGMFFAVTLVLNKYTGTIGEIRGRGNHSPSKKYYPMIMAFMELPFVKGYHTFGHSGGLTFKKLSEHQQELVLRNNPKAGDYVGDIDAAIHKATGRTVNSDGTISGLDDGLSLTEEILDNPAEVKRRIKAGADVHEFKDFALRRACELGFAKTVKVLIDAGANVYVSWCKPLTLARDPEIIEMLWNSMSKEAREETRGDAATEYAKSNSYDALRTIIRLGEKNLAGALSIAIDRGDLVLAKIVTDSGFLRDSTGRPGAAIHAAIDRNRHDAEEMVKLFIKAGDDPTQDYVIAAAIGKPSLMKLLVDSGADAKAEHNIKLLTACQAGDFEAAKNAIDDGADVNAKVGRNYPLGSAYSKGNPDIVRLLLTNGAKVNTSGYGDIYSMIVQQKPDMLRMMLDIAKVKFTKPEYNDLYLRAKEWLSRSKGNPNMSHEKAQAIVDMMEAHKPE